MKISQRWIVLVAAGLCLCALAQPHVSAAQSLPRKEPAQHYLLAEPTSYTDVLDAFDDTDLPDLRVALAFRRTHSLFTIGRESLEPSDRINSKYREVAQSEQITNALSLELAAGVYRDMMVFLRLPLVLSEKRSLRQPPGVPGSASQLEPEDASGAAGGGDPTALFQHNYRSATRSGVPGLDLGFAWGITNQYRTAYLPTWVVLAESRFGLGEVLRPCTADDTCSAGVSRGTITLAIDSRWSYRYSWIEPYLGLRYQVEWASRARSRFAPKGVPDGIETGLPSSFALTLGAALMAWEDRGRFQRLSIDVRTQAEYVSAGRDYSPLFDVLGTSASPQLAAASPGLPAFNGLTQVDGHANMRAELALAAQAAQYIRFRIGVGMLHTTRHLLTGAPACVSAAAGPCTNAEVNPLYRAVIDLPGQRFILLGNLSYDLFASATGQF